MAQTKSKSPKIAAVLNFILPGLGYLYAGVKKKFAWLLIAGAIAFILTIFDPQSVWYYANEQMAYISVWELISSLLLSVAFAYDAFTETSKRK